MRSLFFVLLFSQIATGYLFAQDNVLSYEPDNRIFIEVEAGTSHLLHNTIDEELNNTVNVGAKFCFELPNRVVSIAPIVNLRQFHRPDGYSDDYEYLLTMVKTGLQFNFRLYESPNYKFQMYSFVELNYTWAAYDYRYNDKSNQTSNTPSDNLFEILSGKSPAVMLGYRLKYHFVFVEMAYDIYGSKFYYSDEAKKLLDEQNEEYQSEMDFGINSFNVNIGLSFPIVARGW
jgi:hypothetical protein